MGFGGMNSNFDRHNMKHNLDLTIMKTRLERQGQNLDMPYKSSSWEHLSQKIRKLFGGGKKKENIRKSMSALMEVLEQEDETDNRWMDASDGEPDDGSLMGAFGEEPVGDSTKASGGRGLPGKKKEAKRKQAEISAENRESGRQRQMAGQRTADWSEPQRLAGATGRSLGNPEARSVEELQQAVVWSEILGEPTSKRRRRARESQRYGNQCNADRR